MDQTPAELLKGILNTVERHPNAKVSKLIKCFEEDKTPQNIALLLIELAEHAEFSADISISLKYYLDCFRKLRQEPSFAEAGVVLFNSSKIYAKRVDHIHNEIERLIISLSNVESTEQNVVQPDAPQSAEKVKRGKKRPLEQINGAIEADMSSKRFKKLSSTKRFEGGTPKRNNSVKTHLIQDSDKTTKSYISQSTWQHSAIEDFDYEDEIDSKKNYKLFTYHLEHRYNTLIPDINFKMYFKIKDYINGDCNDSALPESWPPLSDAYIEQFLDLEDVILIKEGHLEKSRGKTDACRISGNKSMANTSEESGIEFDVNSSVGTLSFASQANISENASPQQLNCQASVCGSNSSSNSFDSGIGSEISIQSEATNASQSPISLLKNTQGVEDSKKSRGGLETSLPSETVAESQSSFLKPVGDASESGIGLETSFQLPVSSRFSEDSLNLQDSGCDVLNDSSVQETGDKTETKNESAQITEHDPTLLGASKSCDEDLSTLKIILPHLPDEGIFFSDLDEKDRQMLSPAVVTQDVFGCLKDKTNIVIQVDDAIEHLFKIRAPSEEILSLPLFERPNFSLHLNVLKIPLKYFNKQRRFKLTQEFDLLKKERLKKYIKRSSVITCTAAKKSLRLTKRVEVREHISPPSTPSYEPDWLGFPEESSIDKNRTLSRDSGISLHPTDREINEDFADAPDLLSSTINPMDFDDDSIKFQESLTPAVIVPAEEIPAPSEKPLEETAEPQLPSADNQINLSTDDGNGNSAESQLNQLDDLNEENRVRTKVHEWHNHLQPILACSRERHHFDVFALGTEIMTQFDRNDVSSEKVSFKNVMEEKDESLISRYFLSMLLLANQGNIIIDVQNKSTNQPSDLHDIRLKLLSRKRNIVSLEDNIGLRTPSSAATATTRIDTQSADGIVRTLKSVPEVPKMDDRDSCSNVGGIDRMRVSNI